MNPEEQLYVDKKVAEFETTLLRSNKTPWGLIISVIGISLVIISGAYTIIVIPIHNRIDKLERHLEVYAEESLQEHKELFKHYRDLPKR